MQNRAMACRISAGWPVRNRNISAAVTGRVDRYSRSDEQQQTRSAARPKAPAPGDFSQHQEGQAKQDLESFQRG